MFCLCLSTVIWHSNARDKTDNNYSIFSRYFTLWIRRKSLQVTQPYLKEHKLKMLNKSGKRTCESTLVIFMVDLLTSIPYFLQFREFTDAILFSFAFSCLKTCLPAQLVRIRVESCGFDSAFHGQLWKFVISQLAWSGVVRASVAASYHLTIKDSTIRCDAV